MLRNQKQCLLEMAGHSEGGQGLKRAVVPQKKKKKKKKKKKDLLYKDYENKKK
jgi:hypothetical protein